MQLHPAEWRFPDNAAVVLQGERRTGDALRLMNRAIQLGPRAAAPHRLLGTWLIEVYRTDLGLPLLERAVALDGDDAESLLRLGAAWLAEQELAGVEELAERAVARFPEHVGAHLLLAHVAARTGRGGARRASARCSARSSSIQ